MFRKSLVIAAIAAAVGIHPAAGRTQTPSDEAATPQLKLTFEAGGMVSLSAQHVTIRDILAEWARQCDCYIVNADKLQGGPLQFPMLFEHEPQAKVLDSLLRQAAGYALTPRRAGNTGPSNFETIYILATSTSSPTGAAYMPAYVPPPAPPPPLPTPGAPDDEIPPVVPVIPRDPSDEPPQEPPVSQPSALPPEYPSVFVPIVPIGPGPSPQPGQPGMMPPVPPGGVPPGGVPPGGVPPAPAPQGQ